jgi:hypothetical protein
MRLANRLKERYRRIQRTSVLLEWKVQAQTLQALSPRPAGVSRKLSTLNRMHRLRRE